MARKRKQRQPQEEKQTVLTKDIGGKIHGFALSLAFIAVGLLLIYDNSYFGNETVSTVVRWLFIVLGALGLSREAFKIGKNDVKGVGTFVLGAIFIAIWLTLYMAASSWIIHTFAFLFLILGMYGAIRGLFEILFSIGQLVKMEKKKRSSAVTDALLIITAVLGLVLVAIQIVLQIRVISGV